MKFRTRLKRIPGWLWKARFVGLALAVVVPILVFALSPGVDASSIRLWGLLLQVLGILTVIWGISKTRSLFGHPPVFHKSWEWIKRCPLWAKRDVLAIAGNTAVEIESAGDIHVVRGAGKNATVEQRLEALEQNVTEIHSRISSIQGHLQDRIKASEDALSQETRERTKGNEELREKLEATGTGGVHISAIGALWLLVGVTLSTAAPEIVCIVKYVQQIH